MSAVIFGAAGYFAVAPGGGLLAMGFLVWMGFCPAYFGVTGFLPPWEPE